MAQIRRIEWKAPVDSFRDNLKFVGALFPGRYTGFNSFGPATGTLNFSVSHAGDLIYKEVDQAAMESLPLGKYVTRQGVIIEEDDAIGPLTCATNAGNAFARIDLLVANHTYSTSVIGGTVATYSVITGANGGPVVPALPLPLTQIVLGQILIPASAANLNSALYTQAPRAALGGEPDAKLLRENVFSKLQQFHQGAAVGFVTAEDTIHKMLDIGDVGNLITISTNPGANISTIRDKQVGTRIQILNNSGVSITFEQFGYSGATSGDIAKGFMPLIALTPFPALNFITIPQGGIIEFTRRNLGLNTVWECTACMSLLSLAAAILDNEINTLSDEAIRLKFEVLFSADFNPTINAPFRLDFNTQGPYNTGANGWNTGTYGFTAPKTGWYRVSGQVTILIPNGSTRQRAFIMAKVNGTYRRPLSIDEKGIAGNTISSHSFSQLIYILGGQIMEIWVDVSTGNGAEVWSIQGGTTGEYAYLSIEEAGS